MTEKVFQKTLLNRFKGIESKFKEIESRLKEIEKNNIGSNLRMNLNSKKAGQKASSARLSLADHIIALRDKGFFRQSRANAEVHRKVNSFYPCAPDRVAMALLRLGKRRMLRKAPKLVGDKRLIAYVW